MIRIILAVLLLAVTAQAQDVYDTGDPYDIDNHPRQEYNVIEDRYETVQGEKMLKYNVMEDEYSYQDPGVQPVYNAHEDKYEYPR